MGFDLANSSLDKKDFGDHVEIDGPVAVQAKTFASSP
jgi:hypothetical protein